MNEIKVLRESGMTHAEIGKKFGIKSSRVGQICAKIERIKRHPEYYEEYANALSRYYGETEKE